MINQRNNPDNHKITIIITVIGEKGSGRFALIQQYVDRKYDPTYREDVYTNRQARMLNVDGYSVKTIISAEDYDTLKNHNGDLKGSHAVLMTCDLTDINALDTLQRRIKDIGEYVPKDAIVAIVGTKSDAENIAIKEKDLEDFANQKYGARGLAMIVSSKTGANVQSLFEDVTRAVIKKRDSALRADQGISETTSLLDQYNLISRFSIKFLPAPEVHSGLSKDEISEKLNVNQNDSHLGRADKINILAALSAFKYYSQSSNNAPQQENLLAYMDRITKQNPSLNLKLFDLMLYAKNDGFLIRKKIPNHLRDSLRSLLVSPEDSKEFNSSLKNICNNILKEPSQQEKIMEFFNDNVGDLNRAMSQGNRQTI
jgi:GTPase SAR1 family protein